MSPCGGSAYVSGRHDTNRSHERAQFHSLWSSMCLRALFRLGAYAGVLRACQCAGICVSACKLCMREVRL